MFTPFGITIVSVIGSVAIIGYVIAVRTVIKSAPPNPNTGDSGSDSIRAGIKTNTPQ